MWRPQGYELAERQLEGLVLRSELSAVIQGLAQHLAERHLVRTQSPQGVYECRLRRKRVENRSHAEALRCFLGSLRSSGGFLDPVR